MATTIPDSRHEGPVSCPSNGPRVPLRRVPVSCPNTCPSGRFRESFTIACATIRDLEHVLSQCLLLSRRGRARDGTADSRFTSALLLKILRRGQAPLATLDVERAVLRVHGFADHVNELGADNPEVGWDSDGLPAQLRVKPESVLSMAVEREPFVLDAAFDVDSGADESLLGSDAEASFLKVWAPSALGPAASHWFTPQAPLDRLLESGGLGDGSGARRCDFVFSHPGGPPFAIEVDGPEHDAAADEARDESLRAVGVEVLRVTNAEVLRGHGPALDRIRARCHEALAAFRPVTGDDRAAAALAIDCAAAAKVQFAVARAIEAAVPADRRRPNLRRYRPT